MAKLNKIKVCICMTKYRTGFATGYNLVYLCVLYDRIMILTGPTSVLFVINKTTARPWLVAMAVMNGVTGMLKILPIQIVWFSFSQVET